MSTNNAIPTYRQKENRYMIWTETPEGKRGKAAYGKTRELCLARKQEIEQEYRDAKKIREATEDPFEEGSLAHFVFTVWEPHVYATGRVHLATKQKYDGQVKLHLLPAVMADSRTLGEYQCSQIGYSEFDRLKKSIRRYKRIPKTDPPQYVRTNEPLSPSEQREILLRGREILNLYNAIESAKNKPVRWDWKVVELPKKPKKKERPPVPKGFAAKLIAQALRSSTPWMAGHLFMAQFLGLREAECCGLWREDLNRERGEINLRRQRRFQGKGKGYKDVALKSDTSERTLFVPDEFFDRLEEYASPNSVKHLILNNAGGPCKPGKLCEVTPLLCKDAGLPVVGFHDLRSYAATNLYEVGVDLYTIKSILGHATIDVTLKYLNERPAPQRAGFSKLLKALDERVDDSSEASA